MIYLFQPFWLSIRISKNAFVISNSETKITFLQNKFNKFSNFLWWNFHAHFCTSLIEWIEVLVLGFIIIAVDNFYLLCILENLKLYIHLSPSMFQYLATSWQGGGGNLHAAALRCFLWESSSVDQGYPSRKWNCHYPEEIQVDSGIALLLCLSERNLLLPYRISDTLKNEIYTCCTKGYRNLHYCFTRMIPAIIIYQGNPVIIF